MRDILRQPPEEAYWREKQESGWKLVAVEWERETAQTPPPGRTEEIPYGLEVAPDCLHLKENPHEMEILALMMDLIVDDKPMSKVAGELNRQGYHNRAGRKWTRQEVFQMLPRLIEVGPRIFSAEDWETRRGRLLRAV